MLEAKKYLFLLQSVCFCGRKVFYLLVKTSNFLCLPVYHTQSLEWGLDDASQRQQKQEYSKYTKPQRWSNININTCSSIVPCADFDTDQ